MALRRIKNKKFISSSANWFFSDIRPKNISKKRKFYIQSIIEMLDLVSTFKDSKKSHITIPKEIVSELKKIFSAENIFFNSLTISLGIVMWLFLLSLNVETKSSISIML